MMIKFKNSMSSTMHSDKIYFRFVTIITSLVLFYIFIPGILFIPIIDFYWLSNSVLIVFSLIFSGIFFIRPKKTESPGSAHCIPQYIELLRFLFSFYVFILLLLLIIQGANPFSEGRNQLFNIRENLVGPWASIACLYISSLSGLIQYTRYPKLSLVCTLIVILFDITTLSRGNIMIVFVSFFIFHPNIRYSIILFLLLFFVVVFRMTLSEVPLNLFNIIVYALGESKNIFLGLELMDLKDFSLTWPQIFRPIIALVPGVGRIISMPSEAYEYNILLKNYFDMFGHSFGVAGYIKFATFPQIIVLAIEIFIINFFSKHFRIINVNVMIALYVGTLISFFRWSPGEALAIYTRIVLIIFVFRFIYTLFLKK